MSGPRLVEVATTSALAAPSLAQAREVGSEPVAIAIGSDAVAAAPTAPLNPCAQGVRRDDCAPLARVPTNASGLCTEAGKVGEGCEPLAANASQEGSAQSGSLPPPSFALQAGGGAKAAVTGSATHTATLAHPANPQTFAKQSEGPGVGGAVFALILVVSLILALGWLAKRMPGFGRATGGGNALRIVGSLTLGPRDRVVVVDVGGTQLLLGVGQNGMTTLHTLSEPLPVAQPSQGTPSLQNLATPFAQLLAKHLGKKP